MKLLVETLFATFSYFIVWYLHVLVICHFYGLIVLFVFQSVFWEILYVCMHSLNWCIVCMLHRLPKCVVCTGGENLDMCQRPRQKPPWSDLVTTAIWHVDTGDWTQDTVVETQCSTSWATCNRTASGWMNTSCRNMHVSKSKNILKHFLQSGTSYFYVSFINDILCKQICLSVHYTCIILHNNMKAKKMSVKT